MRLVLLGALLVACGNGGDAKQDAPADGFDRHALLAHLSRDVIAPIQTTFATKAQALPGAVAAYCAALEAGNVTTEGDAAKAAWGEAIDVWERAEALMVGPAAMDDGAVRLKIYSWPQLRSCEI